MIIKRGIAHTFLFFALLAAISSSHVAEGFFHNVINGLKKQIKHTFDHVINETTKKFSVLSSVFGEGVTRGDLSVGQVFGGAFSRNNGVWVNGTETDTDWKLGDGSSVVAAMSTGGSITVSNGGSGVSITTGSQSQNKDEKKEKPSENNSDKKTPDNSSDEDATESVEPTDDSNVTVDGDNMDDAFFKLMEDWDAFVTSSIWDVQDNKNETNTDSLPTSSRVINGVFFGNHAASGASFAVKFFFNNEENFYCSGSLIGYPYVLTAAHCGVVVGDQVRVGSRLIRSGYQATVAEVITHPDFDASTLQNDVAIVRLDGLMDKKTLIKNNVKAARINRVDSFPKKGFVGVLSGHGATETDGKGISDELRTTRHNIYKMDKCKKEITQGNVRKDDDFLCAGDGERSTTCVGDSGAGLWRYVVTKRKNGTKGRFYQIFGVVSFGEVTDQALCPRGPPTVFQRTSTHAEWIEKVIKKKNMA